MHNRFGVTDDVWNLFFAAYAKAPEASPIEAAMDANGRETVRYDDGQEVAFSDGEVEERAQPKITHEIVTTVQSIGRKSVNAFTSEDIKKTEPFAKQYWKEMGAKSPFFRAWFGDWRANDSAEVHLIDTSDETKGTPRNNDTGWDINVSRKVFSESLSHTAKANRIGARLLPYINGIVRNAVLLDSVVTGEEKGSTSVMMHSLYGIVRDGSEMFVVKLFVQEMRNPITDGTIKRSYQLKGCEVVKNTTRVTVEGNKSPARISNGVSSIRTVSDLFAAVKQNDKDFHPNSVHTALVNADGTPKVFDHGTNAAFSVFDLMKSGANYGDVSEGLFYFTDMEKGYVDSASDYAQESVRLGRGFKRVAKHNTDVAFLRNDSFSHAILIFFSRSIPFVGA